MLFVMLTVTMGDEVRMKMEDAIASILARAI